VLGLLYTNHTIDQLHPEAIGVITTNLDKPSVHENNCFVWLLSVHELWHIGYVHELWHIGYPSVYHILAICAAVTRAESSAPFTVCLLPIDPGSETGNQGFWHDTCGQVSIGLLPPFVVTFCNVEDTSIGSIL